MLCFILVACYCSSPVLILINSVDHSYIIYNDQTIAPLCLILRARNNKAHKSIEVYDEAAVGEAFCQ